MYINRLIELKQSRHLRSKQDIFLSVPFRCLPLFPIYASDNDIWFCADSLEDDARMISLEEELQQLKEEMERMKAKGNVSPSLLYPSIHTCPRLPVYPFTYRLSFLSYLPNSLVHAYLCPHLTSLSNHIYPFISHIPICCPFLPSYLSTYIYLPIQLLCCSYLPNLSVLIYPACLTISTQHIYINLLIHPHLDMCPSISTKLYI